VIPGMTGESSLSNIIPQRAVAHSITLPVALSKIGFNYLS